MSDDNNNAPAEAQSASTISTITKKQWLIAASIVVTVLVIVYTILHALCYSNRGEKIRQLSKTEFVAITSIVQSDSTVCSEAKEDRVFDYLDRVMELKYSCEVKELIKEQGVSNVNYLSTYPFRVKSYFWLTDYWVLLEVIFWSLFGLMANLMYSVTRSREEDVDGDGKMEKYEIFDPTRIPEHIGKFWYTPFTSVIIYLSMDALTSSGEIKETPEGPYVVVFAFLLGFFTRRTIALLRKLKDIFFPTDDSSSSKPAEPEEAQPEPQPIQFPAVTISGTVQSNETNSKVDFGAGTIIKLHAQSDPNTVLQSVTVAKGANGEFAFADPVSVGEYGYTAEKTIKTVGYSGAGNISVDGSAEEVTLVVLLKENAG